MTTLVFSTKPFEKPFLHDAIAKRYEIAFTSVPLTIDTVIRSAGFDAVSVFTADDLSGPVLEALYRNGIRYVAIRAAGYDNMDLRTAAALGIKVANVPAYSPYAIAEHALALMLALNRKLIIADKQVHRHDFRVDDLVGFNLHGADVYEREKGIFFQDWSAKELEDEVLETLLQMPNVLITPHQAFATAEALNNIAAATFYNIDCWAHGEASANELAPPVAAIRSNVNIL